MHPDDPRLAATQDCDDSGAAPAREQTRPMADADQPGAELVAPQRLGRYHVLEQIGAGAMGVVLAAYDPDLDRKVAVKLLRGGQGVADSPIRLLREAQALARLSHPNVVQVYDAGVVGEQVFIAMEFVRGQDLRAWLAARRREPPEILRVFLEAGRGLAAAHDAGLVHRDFKPDNVLIGADGRARVADFGLARRGEDGPEAADERPGKGPLSLSLTASGAILGTPAYMSPEQHMGRPADARSDLFSFCVALWEALHGRRPFPGHNFQAIVESLLAGRIEPPPDGARASRRLTDVLRRGLARRPEDRPADMHALLAALARDPARARRTWLAGLLVTGLLGGAALAGLSWRARQAAVCSGAAQELAVSWDEARREAVARALAADPDPDLPARALAGLDAYALGWMHEHRDACLDHHRGEQSAALLDARVRCLDRRRKALASAAAVLAGAPGDAAQVVARLPALTPCSDPEAVLTEAPRTDDPALARRAGEIDGRLAEARTRHHAGDLGEAALQARQAAEAARQAGLRDRLAEALLTYGQVQMTAEAWQPAREALTEAVPHALATARDDLAAEALARGLFIVGVHNGDLPAARAALPIAEAVAERLPEPDAALARVINNRGALALAAGDREAAHADFARALDLLRRAPVSDPIDRVLYRGNAAQTDADPQARSAALAGAADEMAALLGPRHRLALELQLNRARYEPDPALGVQVLAATCPQIAGHDPDAGSSCARCRDLQGQLERQLGREADAARSLAAAGACLEHAASSRGGSVQVAVLRARAAAVAALIAGQPAQALLLVDSVRPAVLPYRHLPQAAADLAEFDLIRGEALATLGRADEAAQSLRAAEAALAATHGELRTLPTLLLRDARARLARLSPATAVPGDSPLGPAPDAPPPPAPP